MQWSRAGLTACLTCSTHGVLRALATYSIDPGKPTWTARLKQIKFGWVFYFFFQNNKCFICFFGSLLPLQSGQASEISSSGCAF